MCRGLKTLTKRQLKATIPAPALLGERMWDPVRSAKANSKREDFVRDCVPILRREVELLKGEGVSIIQVDDPHLCLFVDPAVRKQYDDDEKASDFAVDMDNQMVAGISGVNLRFTSAGGPVRGLAGMPTTAEVTTPSSARSRD